MGYDDRYGDDDRGQSRSRNRDQEPGRERYGADRDPGAHADYYQGGDRGQRRMGPEGGFENREDFRRAGPRADQDRDRSGHDDGRRFSDRSRGGSGGVNQGMGAYGGDSGGYGVEGADSYTTGRSGNLGVAPEFGGGPRWDRQDVGNVGTHGAHPVASPYGGNQAGGGFGGGGSARAQAILDEAGQGGQNRQQQGGASQSQSSRPHDPHYSQWRRQQIEALDRDYHEYSQENASRFEKEFGSWREKRGGQRQSMGRVTEHMEVVGSDDTHVGTVDKVKDGRIILTKSDPNAGGHHHSIPCGWLETVDDKVRLNKSAEEAMSAWRDEETSRALFEDKDSGSDGPHILDRAFSGTYRDEK